MDINVVPSSACQTLVDHSIMTTSPTLSVQMSWHGRPLLVLMPKASVDFQYTTDLLVSDALDSSLLSIGAPGLSPLRALDLTATSCPDFLVLNQAVSKSLPFLFSSILWYPVPGWTSAVLPL